MPSPRRSASPRRPAPLATALVFGAAISGVIPFGTGSANADYLYSKQALIDVVPADGAIPARTELEQGWPDETRMKFWFTSQGSRVVPYSWFTALEQVNSQALFRNSSHMESLRYLPFPESAANPSGLPIGFAPDVDKDTDEVWVGLTCAACHTNQLDYQGEKFLIEGAPTLANFVEFYSRLVDVLNQTHADDARFDRFARRVLARSYDPRAARDLRERLGEIALRAAERQNVNALPADYPPDFTSYARLDAFGNIQNAGSAFALNDLNNNNPPTAPVSYPFIWGTHQSDVVQWNASAPNTAIVGPLVRNIGEVVGVFGQLGIAEAPWYRRWLGKDNVYTSSVDVMGVGLLERWVKQLLSPQWPTVLPAVDTRKAATGAALFQSQCRSCHQVIRREDEDHNYIARKIPVADVGTDEAMAENASNYMAKTLILEGTKNRILIGDRFDATAPAIQIPVNGVVGIVLDQPKTALAAGLLSAGANRPRGLEVLEQLREHVEKIEAIRADQSDTLVYKARPLNGIWATAPYLHNGSVPNLWALLQREDDRPEKFQVGSREFDPKHVGYVTDTGLNEFRVRNAAGKIQRGNSNRGHRYGTELSDTQKWALVEYMKTL